MLQQGSPQATVCMNVVSRADPRGAGGPSPLQLVYQWKYREGEREQEVEERRKMERDEEEETNQPVRLLVNDRKFSAGNSVFLSHQTSQQ